MKVVRFLFTSSTLRGYYFDREGIRQHTPGRPVLRHTKETPLYRHAIESDRSITQEDRWMMHDLGFKVEILFTSKLKVNARDVENALS